MLHLLDRVGLAAPAVHRSPFPWAQPVMPGFTGDRERAQVAPARAARPQERPHRHPLQRKGGKRV